MLETDLCRYIEKVGNHQKPISFIAKQPEISTLFADITSQLDGGYLDLDLIAAGYGDGFCTKMKPLLEAWYSNGLIQSTSKRIDLTIAGSFSYVNLTQALLDRFSKPEGDAMPGIDIAGVAARDK